MKRLLSTLIFLLLSTHVLANTRLNCPTIAEIKSGRFGGWLPLYIDSEEMASAKDVETFKAFVTAFEVARWDRDYQENAHCFYRGNRGVVNQIAFAHPAWRPLRSAAWYWIQPDKLAECRQSPAACLYIS